MCRITCFLNLTTRSCVVVGLRPGIGCIGEKKATFSPEGIPKRL